MVIKVATYIIMQLPQKTPQIGLSFAKKKKKKSGCILNLKKIKCEQCIFQDYIHFFIVCHHFASNLVKETYIESEDDTNLSNPRFKPKQ